MFHEEENKTRRPSAGIMYACLVCFSPVWWPGLKSSPTVTHACRQKATKICTPVPGGIAGPPCLRAS
jgi:hypothetical protein